MAWCIWQSYYSYRWCSHGDTSSGSAVFSPLQNDPATGVVFICDSVGKRIFDCCSARHPLLACPEFGGGGCRRQAEGVNQTAGLSVDEFATNTICLSLVTHSHFLNLKPDGTIVYVLSKWLNNTLRQPVEDLTQL